MRHFALGTLLFAYLLGLALLTEQIRPKGEFFELTQRISQQGARNFLAEQWRGKQ